MNVSATAARNGSAAGRPGSASQISPRASTQAWAGAGAALRRCAARRARRRRSRGPTARARRARSGAVQDDGLHLDRQAVARGVALESSRSRPGPSRWPARARPRRPRPATAGRGRSRARARARRAATATPTARARARRARPQLGPVGQELLVLEGVLGEQRFGVARTQQAQVAPADPHHLFDEIVHPRLGCLNQRTASRHQRRRRSPGRRLAVHGLARALRQSGRDGSPRARRRPSRPPRRSSATGRTSPRARCGPASRAASRSSSPTSPTRSSGACSEARSGPPSGPATRSCWSTSATTAPGRPRSLQALLAGPADGLLLFEAELPPGATEHAIQIEMRPGKLPVVRLDVEAGVDCALDHLLGLGHTRIAHVASNFDAPTFDLRRDRDRAHRLGDDTPTALGAVHVRRRGRGGRHAARPGRLHRGVLRRRHPRRRRLSRGARRGASGSPRT